VAEPIFTIALVVLGFTFIPWLSGGRPASGSLTDRLRAGATELEKEIKGEVGVVIDKARRIDVEKLGNQARDRLKKLGGPAEAPTGP
jgi:hypothetical protein